MSERTDFAAGFARPPEQRDTDSCKWRRYAGRDIIPAWIADMDFVAAPPITAAISQRAQHGVFGYTTPMPQLTETAAAYFLRRWQWQVSPEWLVLLPGLGPAIHAVCRMAAGGEVLTPSPIYHAFRTAPAIADAIRTDAPMRFANGEWTLPIATLESALTPQTRVMQLCNPHNPNGKIFSRDELLALGEFCVRHRLILCADEVHADLILDEDKRHLCVAALDPEIARTTITLQSPSKAFNVAGLNFAVAVIPDEKLRARFVAALAGKMITHFNSFGMIAAQTAWGGECDAWLAAVIKQLRANRDMLSAATATIPGIEMAHLSATYLAWLHTQKCGLSPKDFESAGIGMSPGESFGDADYMRLNFACAPSVLQEIIQRLHSACGE